MGSNVGSLIRTIAPLAISLIAPELAPVLGITSGLGTAALGAGLGAGAGLIGGGGIKGAATGALSGGLAGGGGDLISSGLGLSGTAGNVLSRGLTGAATGFSGSGTPLGALEGGLGGAASAGLTGLLNGTGPALDTAGATGGVVDNSLTGNDVANILSPSNTGLTSGGSLNVGGGGASSFGGATGLGGSSFNPVTVGANGVTSGSGSGLSGLFSSMTGGGAGGPNSLEQLISGAGNGLMQNLATNQLVSSQQDSLKAIQPFLKSGLAANSDLSNLLGTGGTPGSAGYGSLTKPFNPSDLTNDPGYQFQLSQGNNALDNMLSASGGLDSGAALKEAQQFGQGLAGTTYNNAFNRNLTQNSNIYSMLAGQSGQGLQAGTDVANINNNIGTAKSKGTTALGNTATSTLAGLLTGSGARPIVGYKQDGTPIYG